MRDLKVSIMYSRLLSLELRHEVAVLNLRNRRAGANGQRGSVRAREYNGECIVLKPEPRAI